MVKSPSISRISSVLTDSKEASELLRKKGCALLNEGDLVEGGLAEAYRPVARHEARETGDQNEDREHEEETSAEEGPRHQLLVLDDLGQLMRHLLVSQTTFLAVLTVVAADAVAGEGQSAPSWGETARSIVHTGVG